jgi:hypothetical protein
MKTILCTLLVAGLPGLLCAQTGPMLQILSQKDIGVRSQHGFGNSQQVVFSDQVCVTNARGQLMCGRLTFNFPPETAADHHPTNAIAETNLVVLFFDSKGGTNRLAADQGVYDHTVAHGTTNELFTFTSNAGKNVRLTSPQGWLTCQRLTLHLPPLGAADNHPTNAVAESNLVVEYVNKDHETNHLTADQGIYNYSVVEGITNETFTFTGHATNTMAQGWMTGEPLVWDVANNSFKIDSNVQIHFRMRHAEGDTNDSPNHL